MEMSDELPYLSVHVYWQKNHDRVLSRSYLITSKLKKKK